jgi:hypothetical protein
MRYLLVFLVLFYATRCVPQNVYGVSGAVFTPDAYTVGDGNIIFTASLHHDRFPNLTQTYEQIGQWSTAINIGLHSRLDAGIRLVGVPSLRAEVSSLPHHYPMDRNINVKFVIVPEYVKFPQIALGFQDFAGTRKYNSTYLVVGKRFLVRQKTIFWINLGYGTPFSKVLYSYPPDGYRLQGLFGSVGIQYKWFRLMSEYETGSFNFGCGITFCKVIVVKLFYTKLNYTGALVSVKTEL